MNEQNYASRSAATAGSRSIREFIAEHPSTDPFLASGPPTIKIATGFTLDDGTNRFKQEQLISIGGCPSHVTTACRSNETAAMDWKER